MKRMLPSPLLSLSLLAMWLVLNPSLDAANVAIAAVLAIAIPAVCAPLRPVPARMRRPATVLRLVLAVGHDVIVSNLEIARGVVLAGRRPPSPQFVTVPLELTDATALAALATITTVVPGTIWTELARDRSAVRLHVFDVTDVTAFIEHYKTRYERPLKEIFE